MTKKWLPVLALVVFFLAPAALAQNTFVLVFLYAEWAIPGSVQ